MRLHHLEVTAFGPFAGRVEVDLERLSSAGLFLLSGPTGAGKTSVLDAICFALYGDVPGDRASAKRLRCDQAAPGVAPRVVLEATLAGRRFRITRSPAWERPKKRGSGSTTQQASVVLAERRDGDWVTLTTRLDEAGHLTCDLLGMTLTQFTQVALLPQGRFQSFLRARSEERKELLQRLFRTERFTDVERWLRDHRLGLRRRSEGLNQRVADAVSRISEATETPLPADWDLGDLSVPAGEGALESWVEGIEKVLHDEHVAMCAAAAEAVSLEADARTALEEARTLAERRQRHDEAAAEHAELAAEAQDVARASSRLEAAQRAAAVAPVRGVAERARQHHERCAATVPAGADLASARAHHRELTRRADAARALLPQERRRAEVASMLGRTRREHEGLVSELDELTERVAEHPRICEALRGDLEAARTAAAAVPALAARIAAYVDVDRLTVEVAEATEAYAVARTQALEARERALDVRQARLESMAAELAGGLAVGACCPVCGSAEHPHKAAAITEAPDADAEKAAQRAADDASSLEHLRGLELRDLQTRLTIAREQAGPAGERPAVAEQLEGARAVAGTLAGVETELRTATERAERDALRLTELTGLASSAATALESLTVEAQALDEALEHALSEIEDSDVAPSVAALVERRERAALDAADLLERIEARDRAAATLAEAQGALDRTLEDAGFATVQEAEEAAVESSDAAAMLARVKHHERRLAVVTAVLAEPGSEDLRDRPIPDIGALTDAHRTALARMGGAQSAVARGATTLGRLAELRTELDAALTAWSPLRRALEIATRVASFAEGKSADNRLQMSLSAYVVAYRLTQVVAAANERLAAMSDQRYQLEHTAARAAGDRRGGLALLVRDDWSGETREPATLSGGETFVVSLALALGLADVITQEAGGAMLDTLFVDEGFGSLDAETLDDVMAVLDGLRDGGRVVGVVSHVAELRDRIPTQLVVGKSRTGSVVTIR